MKKGYRISLILLLIVAVVISVVWVYRSVIMKKILIEIVASRSNGEMVLNLDKIDYQPFNKKIEIFDLSLIVSPSDTLDNKYTKLRSISFDSIIISEFDIWKILYEKRIKAGKILTAKPDIVFSQAPQQSENHTTIGDHFNSVQTKGVKLKIFPIEIGLLKVEYGNILFETDSANHFLGSADFSVELYQFNTSVDSLEFDSHSFLYSRRLIIDISNFSKTLKGGKDLNIENLKFDSKTDKLEITNFNITKGSPDLDSPLDSIFLRSIEIDGLSISEIKKEKDLKLRSIKVNNGFVSIKPLSRSKNKKTEVNTVSLKFLFQFIQDIDIDTLLFNNINCDFIGLNNTKIASVVGANFQFLGLSIDTTLYSNNLVPDLDYIEFDIERFSFDSIQQIEIHDIFYSSRQANLKMSNVLFKDTLEYIDFKSDGILLEGLDIIKILNNKSNNVVLNLTNPQISLNLASKYFSDKKNKTKSKFVDLVKLEKVKLYQANISLFNNTGFNSEISNLDISFSISPKGKNTSSKLNLTDLSWASKTLNISITDQNINFSSLSSTYKNNNLNFSNGDFELIGSVKQQQISVKFQNLSIIDFDIIDAINLNKLATKQIILQKPDFEFAFHMDDSLKSIQQRDSLLLVLPLDISIGEFFVNDANLKVVRGQGSEQLNFSSGLNLSIKDIELPGEFGLEQIKQLGLDLDLSNSQFENDNIVAFFEKFNFSTADSNICIQNINLQLDSLVLQNSVLFSNKLTIKGINISQLDYLEIFRSKDFTFNKLKIVEPHIDLYSYGFTKEIEERKDLKPLTYNFSKESFKEIEIQSLKFNFEFSLNDQVKKIEVGDFDLVWTPKKEESSNLITELLIDIKNFELLNIENQTKVKVKRVYTNKLINDLEIRDIVISKPGTIDQNGLYVRIPLLTLRNITHNSQQAYRIEIEELSSDTLILEFNNSVSEHEKLNLSGRVEALEKYSDFVSMFNIRTSSFYNVDISINNISDSTHKEFLLDELDIFVSDVGFTSEDSTMLHLNKITLDLRGRKLITPDSLYAISSGEIFYDFANNSIIIDSFKLKPRYSREEFYERAVFQTDMLDISGDRIVLSGIDFKKAITEKEYLISAINLEGFKLSAHRNKTYPFKHGVIKPFPSEILRSLNTKFYVDTLRVNNSYILFGEYVEGSDRPGEMFFEDVNITVREFSNMPKLMTYPPEVKLGFESKVMGNSLVTANIVFPLNTNAFSFSGKTEEIDFRDFNSMTQNLFGISITKGKGYFDILGITAGDSLATGSIKFRYKKLRIGLYDREKAEVTKGIAAPFFSFLVNDLLIKSNNPRFLGKTRTGLVYIEPNREKAFINYIWKSLLSGIMSTMWHNSKEQRKEKRRINIIED